MYKVIVLCTFHISSYFYMIKSYFGYLKENLEDVRKVLKLFLNILIEVFTFTFCVIAVHKYMF